MYKARYLYKGDRFMGLYDRDYARGNEHVQYGTARSESQIVAFVKETYKLFAASMMAGAAGAYVGIPYAATLAAYHWPLFFLVIGLLIALHFTKQMQGVNLALLFAFTFATGLMIAPMLASTLAISGGGAIVANAFAMTSVIFGAMSFYAIKTTKDFTGYGKPLLIALVVIIGGSLLNMFLFQSPIMHILIQGAVVMLFSVMIVYDTQNIISGAYETAVEGAVALYLDFFNIFTALLQLFGIFGSKDD